MFLEICQKLGAGTVDFSEKSKNSSGCVDLPSQKHKMWSSNNQYIF